MGVRQVLETIAGVTAVVLPLVVLTIVMLSRYGVVGLFVPLIVLGVVGLLLEIARGLGNE